MGFCKNCGRQTGQDVYCTVCGGESYNHGDSSSIPEGEGLGGARIPDSPRPIYRQTTSTVDTTQMLIWSVVSTLCCCTPLGIAALIFVFKAKGAPPYEAESNLGVARILNIISLVIFIISLILNFGKLMSSFGL